MDEPVVTRQNVWTGTFFRTFAIAVIITLLGLHFYTYFFKPLQEGFDGDFNDIKYIVVQLTKGLNDVNRKHEQLKSELERVSSGLPRLAMSSERARDALMSCRKTGLEMDYDRQITDFALESAGAKVIDTGDTVDHVLFESTVGYLLHSLSSVLCRGQECLNARIMIRPGSLPGECWAFKGNKGEATIRLLGTIFVSGVTMEHITPKISPTKDIASAPRLFQLEGLQHRGDVYPHLFGTFEYKRDGRPIQYFEVINPSHRGFNVVRVRILSNWGHPTYTCVYRVRVHGELANEHAAGAPDDGKGIDDRNI